MDTDIPTWEQYKENAAPLERGRNVEILEQSLRVDTEEERQAKENSIRHYENLVRPSEEMASNGEDLGEEDDPLIHWLSYIKFHQDYFPSDNQSQFLLIERCTRTLLGQKKYANDVRFIRICVLYADQTSNPGEIFRYLHSQKVGTLTALFWIAWAFWAEKQEDFPFAEKIFKKGISKKAHPLSMIEMRHKQFERRMARHWMNMARRQAEGLDDTDDLQHDSRGVLGSLSEEAFRRNDRAGARSSNNLRPRTNDFPSTSMATFTDRSAARTGRYLPSGGQGGGNGSKPASNTAAGFQIFVEGDQENNEEYNLDHPGHFEEKRQFPREDERRKENTLNAERWNQRSGLQTAASLYAGVGVPVAPVQKPQSFQVYVDEKCAAQHQREELHQVADEGRQRRHRDERTFRPIDTGGSIAEKLRQDPLCYLKDPSQLGGDQRQKKPDPRDGENDDGTEKAFASVGPRSYSKLTSRLAATLTGSIPLSNHPKTSTSDKKRGACGFDKALLAKDSTGQEQCFEEQRASCGYFKVVSSETNFNLLHQNLNWKKDDSGMEIDDTTTVGELSIIGEKITTDQGVVSQRSQKSSRRVLFRNDTSFEAREGSMNNVSQCSSTVNEAHAVGIDNPDEETINTKLAMKELSMMFSSPAWSLGGTSEKAKKKAKTNEQDFVPSLGQQQSSFDTQSKVDDINAYNYDSGGETADPETFATILDLVDSAAHTVINNSIIQSDENRGPRNPLSRAAYPQEIIDRDALRTLESDAKAGTVTSCILDTRVAQRKAFGPIAQDDPLSRAPVNELHDNPGFAIYEDREEQNKSEIQQARAQNGSSGFEIFEDRKLSVNGAGLKTVQDGRSGSQKEGALPVGTRVSEDQNKCPEIEDKEQARAKGASGFAIFEDAEDLPETNSDGGDTATLSVFGDLMASIKPDDEEISPNENKRRREFLHNEREDLKPSFAKGSLITDPRSFGDISVIMKDPNKDVISIASPTLTMNLNIQAAIDYNKQHRTNIRSALVRLKELAKTGVESCSSLTKLLSVKTLVYEEPRYVLPKIFKKKLLEKGSEIKIGSSCGIVKQELGRGAYGVVVLLNTDSESTSTIAVKAQSCPDSLAWEYEILQKIETRIVEQSMLNETGAPLPFPKALAFVSLADGGLMSMTAASESGLNLVDVVNLYKSRLGENVPELLALHYAARMLCHVETLHWHGKILHCDVKPDNWVLCTSSGVPASDLTLVDFGRAVDLKELAREGSDALDIKLVGAASEKDMQCAAMRKDRPWSLDADTFGICASAHVLLFGTHIEVEQDRDRRWKPRQRFRRYWQVELWGELFDTLLNTEEGMVIGSRPRSLKALRKQLEAYLDKQRHQVDEVLLRQARMLPLSRLHLKSTGK